MVEEDYGRDVALAVARFLVVFLKRPGGQTQFSVQLAAQIASRPPIQRVQAWIRDNLGGNLSLDALAKHAGMSKRNLSRVFREDTGMSPVDFVDAMRLEAARRLLEDSNLPLKRVATLAGFKGTDPLRSRFIRRLGVAPQAYRSQFRSSRIAFGES